MKGIILAGGKATRLYPLTEFGIVKQLLPLYDRPIIYYPLQTLIKSGITEILIISSLDGLPMLKEYLGNGDKWGVKLEYALQQDPKGLAEAFIIGETFIGDDDVTLILGDNIFLQNEFDLQANTIYTYSVNDPNRYGVAKFSDDGTLDCVVEKPQEFISTQAVVGLYSFTNSCVEIAKNVLPSERGEVEIVDVINAMSTKEKVDIVNVDDRMWFDVGTFDSLLDCANLVAAYKTRTNIQI
jgi:glucose-1-phosphate thymidylyltransferase